jgi:hypothetical protein
LQLNNPASTKKMKTKNMTTSQLRNSISPVTAGRGFLLIPLMLALACFALSPTARAQLGISAGENLTTGNTLIGDGLTQSSNVTGGVSSLFSFMFNVTNLSGDLGQHIAASARLSSSTDTVAALDQISSSSTSVGCLQVSADGTTAWWSGTVFFQTPDARLNPAVNDQILNDVRAGVYIVGGKIINGGQVEKRSLFLSGAQISEVSLNDAGSISSVIPPILGRTGGTYCTLRDRMYDVADYKQLDTIRTGTPAESHHCVTGRVPSRNEKLCDIEWLDPNDNSFSPRVRVANTPDNLANPPAASLYNLSAVVRLFTAGRVVIE